MATTKKSGFYHVSTTRKTKCECVNREKLTTYRYQYCDAISLKIYTKNNSHILLLFVIRGRCYRHRHSRQFATLQFWFHTQISMMNVKYSDLNKFDYTKIWGTSQQQHQSSIFAVFYARFSTNLWHFRSAWLFCVCIFMYTFLENGAIPFSKIKTSRINVQCTSVHVRVSHMAENESFSFIIFNGWSNCWLVSIDPYKRKTGLNT